MNQRLFCLGRIRCLTQAIFAARITHIYVPKYLGYTYYFIFIWRNGKKSQIFRVFLVSTL